MSLVPKMSAQNVNITYGDLSAVEDVSLELNLNEVTALIGPSGSGKSTFLRCLNRMNEAAQGIMFSGKVFLDGQDIYDPSLDVVKVRAKVGMVFQRPNPFPKSIYDNIAYGPRIHGLVDNPDELDETVASCLEQVGLWEEVKDRLASPGTSLSLGQQQRLCIARTLSVRPEVILMDEPCSALDPIATAKIEALIDELKEKYAIAIVTHNMQQAARVSQKTAFFHLGKLVEHSDTIKIFTAPTMERTRDYITGRFG